MDKALTLFLCIFICSCGSGLTYETPQLPATLEHIYSITKIEPGDMCVYGGSLIKIGNDANADGILDNDEINVTKLVCNDEQGFIVTETPLAPGVDCPLGGVMITTGADLNGDGIIDKIDPNKIIYICNVINDDGGGAGNSPLISVTYGPGDVCLDGKATIKNNTNRRLDISFVSNSNIFPAAFRDELSSPYYGFQTIPSSLPPLGEADINLDIQPDKEGDIDILYAIKAWDGTKSYTFAETGKCHIADNSVATVNDILVARYDVYLSSYKGEPDKNNRCKAGKDCMLGIPYGIRKGLYPLDIKIDWGDGSEIDYINVRNLSMEPVSSHIFGTAGRSELIIFVKAKNMADYLELPVIRVVID